MFGEGGGGGGGDSMFGGALALQFASLFGMGSTSPTTTPGSSSGSSSSSSSSSGLGGGGMSFGGNSNSKPEGGKKPSRSEFLVDILGVSEAGGVRTAEVQLFNLYSEEVLTVLDVEQSGAQGVFAGNPALVLGSRVPSMFSSAKQRFLLHTRAAPASRSELDSLVWLTVPGQGRSGPDQGVFRQCCVADADGESGLSLPFLRVGPVTADYATDESNLLLVDKKEDPNAYVKDEFSDFEFDFQQADLALQPVQVGSRDFINNSSKLQNMVPTVLNTYGTARVFSWNQGFIAGADADVDTRLPVVVDGLLELGFDSLTGFGALYTNRLEEAVMVMVGMFIPPYTKLRATFELQMGRINAPFVGTLRRTFDLQGVYKRVLTYRVPGIFKETMISNVFVKTSKEVQLPIIFAPSDLAAGRARRVGRAPESAPTDSV
jgi:hypothetical protein